MKKLIFLLMALVMMGNMSFAQGKKTNPKSATAQQKVDKKEEMAQSKRTKKDGSPDMRYKANKEAAAMAKPVGPLKKDGTPDKRFKANQQAEKK